jgi:hypothetical protein
VNLNYSRKLGENPRKGSSLAAIKGYMAEEWGVDIRQLANKIKNFILNAVSDGEIIQTRGKSQFLLLRVCYPPTCLDK